ARMLPRSSTLPPRPAPAEARRLLAGRGYRWLLLVIFLAIGAHSAYDLCLTLRLRALGASGGFVGTAWAVGTAAEIVLMATLAPYIERLGPARLVVVGAASGALRWTLLATVTSLPTLMLLQPLHALSFGLLWVSALAVLKERAAGSGLATAQGLFSASMATGSTLGMSVWGPSTRRAAERESLVGPPSSPAGRPSRPSSCSVHSESRVLSASPAPPTPMGQPLGADDRPRLETSGHVPPATLLPGRRCTRRRKTNETHRLDGGAGARALRVGLQPRSGAPHALVSTPQHGGGGRRRGRRRPRRRRSDHGRSGSGRGGEGRPGKASPLSVRDR